MIVSPLSPTRERVWVRGIERSENLCSHSLDIVQHFKIVEPDHTIPGLRDEYRSAFVEVPTC